MAKKIDFEVEFEPGKTTRTEHTQIEIVGVVTHVWTFKEIMRIIFTGLLIGFALAVIISLAEQNRARGYSTGRMPATSRSSTTSTAPVAPTPTRDLSISSNRAFVECHHTSVRGLPCFHNRRK